MICHPTYYCFLSHLLLYIRSLRIRFLSSDGFCLIPYLHPTVSYVVFEIFLDHIQNVLGEVLPTLQTLPTI